MTKVQAIKCLRDLGWTQIVSDTLYRSCVWASLAAVLHLAVAATSPEGQRGLFNPRDLLAEASVRERDKQ